MTLNRAQVLLGMKLLQSVLLVEHVCDFLHPKRLNFTMLAVNFCLGIFDHRCVLLRHHHVDRLRVQAFRDDGVLATRELFLVTIGRMPEPAVLMNEVCLVSHPRRQRVV